MNIFLNKTPAFLHGVPPLVAALLFIPSHVNPTKAVKQTCLAQGDMAIQLTLSFFPNAKPHPVYGLSYRDCCYTVDTHAFMSWDIKY